MKSRRKISIPENKAATTNIGLRKMKYQPRLSS